MSVMGGDVKAYNAGKFLDLNVLSGGNGGDIATLGGKIFGQAGQQGVDAEGGNRILMHAQTGGSKKRKTASKKRVKGYGKHKKGGAKSKKSRRPSSKKSRRTTSRTTSRKL
jgi:hypothetical protein